MTTLAHVPAFPLSTTSETTDYYGLSKREFFAIQALSGLGDFIPAPTEEQRNAAWENRMINQLYDFTGTQAMTRRAEWAVRQADALIAALQKEAPDA